MGFFNSSTHTFKLVSGVEAEVRELVGKHQKILTQAKRGETHTDRLNMMLADVLIRVGSVTNITRQFVEDMLSEDRKLCLIMARQFSMDFEKVFTFDYAYEKGKEMVHFPVEINLTDEGLFPVTRMPEQYTEYSEIVKEHKFTLPRSNVEVSYRLLDGHGEKIGANTKKEERSSHTIIEMRRPTYMHNIDGAVPVKMALPLDKLSMKDISALREDIKRREGKLDTEIQFEHPDWAVGEMTASERYIKTDVLDVINFFFPSGSI